MLKQSRWSCPSLAAWMYRKNLLTTTLLLGALFNSLTSLKVKCPMIRKLTHYMVPTINSPAQLSRDEVAVRTVLCWILVHAAEKAFLTRIIGYTQLREYRIDLHQNGPIERIDGCQIVVVVLSGIRHRLILCRNSRGSRTLNTGYIFYEFAVSQRKHHSSGGEKNWRKKESGRNK